jgi:hypothetical protein
LRPGIADALFPALPAYQAIECIGCEIGQHLRYESTAAAVIKRRVTKVADWHRPEVQELVAQLGGTDPHAARSAALELGDRREYGAVPAMLEILAATSHAGVRNGVAYALSAMCIPETFEVIVDLLQQNRTRGTRGTLLYALRPFDCAPVLPLLVGLVIEDTWESAREAAYLISELETVSAEAWNPLKDRLRMAYEAIHPPYSVKDAERRDVIKFLVDFFEEFDEPA